jgi:Ca2+-transporting ATPase
MTAADAACLGSRSEAQRSAGMHDDLTLRGLSESEAASRLRAEGFNELPHTAPRTLARIAWEVCREPMFELLLVAAAIYFALGDLGEALVLTGSALGTVIIAVFQENRTERVLESLRDLTSPRALVIRDGVQRRIAGREVVRGDIVVLAEGDRVPADAWLLSSNDLQADESLLTGESVPVRKAAGPLPPLPLHPGGDDLPVVFSGTVIVRGQGIGQVQAVGPASEIGRIGKTLSEIKDEPTPLHAQTRRLVRVLATIGIALSALTVIFYGLLRGSWLNGLLAGVALAMSILPEEFPIVLTIFLVMGAWRISKVRVLTRRSAAIEALGAATILCADKTGTLTLNQMSVAALWTTDGVLRLDGQDPAQLAQSHRALLEFGALASESAPTDPMEKAIHAAAQRFLNGAGDAHTGWVLAHEYPLSPGLFATTHVWQPPEQTACVVAAKGAPETIAQMCRLTPARLAAMQEAARRLASRGIRVLAVARARFEGARWPDSQLAFPFELLGLIGLADPLRPNVAETIRECRAAGIKVVMITGDYPVTARAIADEAGLDGSAGLIAGDELNTMNEQALRARAGATAVFARITPHQKLRIVEAFKANGEIVAMTGDGVNDAPSLRAANIGIAMGARGTDVAREAAAIVLLDDELSSVVRAVRLGRRIYDNLRKAMGYLLAVHVPIAGLALLPLVAGWPLIFSPVHIAFLELVIDPVSSIVFESEAEESDVMRRPPRAPGQPLFALALVAWSLFQGLWVLLQSAAIFAVTLNHGFSARQARAVTFASLVAANLALIFVNRSFKSSLLTALRRPNTALWLIIAVTAALLATTFVVPALRGIFGFALLQPQDLVLIVAAGLAPVLVLESIKKVLGSLNMSPV